MVSSASSFCRHHNACLGGTRGPKSKELSENIFAVHHHSHETIGDDEDE